MIAKGKEQNDISAKKKAAEDELALRKQRAEEARAAIHASGDSELIAKLRLMDATSSSLPPSVTMGQSANVGNGSSILGTAAAVAGGMVVGNAISSAIAAEQFQSAFADIQANIDGNLAEASGSLADGASDIDLSDLDFDI